MLSKYFLELIGFGVAVRPVIQAARPVLGWPVREGGNGRI
jgi:hypothetical protein